MVFVREWTFKRTRQAPRRRLEIGRTELTGQLMYLNVVEGFGVGIPGFSIERFGLADRFRSRAEDQADLEGAMWKLSTKTVREGLELSFSVQNRSTLAWPDPFTLETTVSFRSPQNPAEVTSDRFADAEQRDRTLVHTGSSFFPIRDQRRHYWHQQQIEEILATPGGREAFALVERRPSIPYIGAGAAFRTSTDTNWVLAYGWDQTAYVARYDEYDTISVGLQIGPMKVGEHRSFKGLLLFMVATPEDALIRFRRHVGPKSGYDAKARRKLLLESSSMRRPRQDTKVSADKELT